MDVCRTDIQKLTKYIDDVLLFYKAHASTIRESERARLLFLVNNKLKKKLKNDKR